MATPVWNRKREKKSTRFYLTPTHDPQNLEDTILDLHRCQLAEQLLRTTQEHRRVEVEKQRHVEINQIMKDWWNENIDALDYEGY